MFEESNTSYNVYVHEEYLVLVFACKLAEYAML
jgi:hypothetical protein